jgi:hypothetical protein
MPHIAILVHEIDCHKRAGYFLFEMAKIWRQSGFDITVLCGTEKFVPADLAIMHVDLTIVPDDYLSFIEQYPALLNNQVRDISKRFISNNLIHLDDDYRGSVIVKTNLNCAGARERKLVTNQSLILKCSRFIKKRLKGFMWTDSSASNYVIYDSARDVPSSVWSRQDLVVEKFLPERHGDLYSLRTWVFFGDKETNSICYSEEPIIKSNNIIRRDLVQDVPETLREWRRKLGFDFGKFDYSIIKDQVVLYDANRTPSLGNFSSAQILMPGIRVLAEGINAYIADPQYEY